MLYQRYIWSVTASSQSHSKATTSVNDAKPPTLAKLINSQESFRKKTLERKRNTAWSSQTRKPRIETICATLCRRRAPRVVGLGCKTESGRTFPNLKSHLPKRLRDGPSLDLYSKSESLYLPGARPWQSGFESLLESHSIAQVSKRPE